MIATEIFELLHADKAEPKSIVFSDSRQDAANQALEIERLHLRDLRREILVSAARDLMGRIGRNYVPREDSERISAELAQQKNWPELQRRSAEWGMMDGNRNIDAAHEKYASNALLQLGSGR